MTFILCGFAGILAAFGFMFQFHFSDPSLLFFAVTSLAISCASLVTENWNIVYVLRFVLLGVPAAITTYLLQTQALGSIVMNYAALIQSRELSVYILLLTALAISGHGVGWALSHQYFRVKTPVEPINSSTVDLYFWFYLVISLISSTMLANMLGPYIWESAYTSLNNPPAFGIGSYNFFVATSILGLFSALIYEKKISKIKALIFIATAIYSLFFCMLFRGMRAEFVGVLVGLTALVLLWYRIKLKGWYILGAFIGGYIFVVGWGAFRASAAWGFSFTDAVLYMNSRTRIYDFNGNYLFQTGTFGDIAATLYNSVALVATDAVTTLKGQSYLDYILRTLPQILYPERPRDLSFLFYDYEVAYGGGIFELSEAYLNFSTLGCFIVPALISFGIGSVYQRAAQARTFIALFATGVLTAALFRGTLYQTFVFYRAITIFIALHAVVMAIDYLNQRGVLRWKKN